VTASAGTVVDAARQLLAGYGDVEGALIYGSVARGSATAESDVDLFVVTNGTVDPGEHDRLRLDAGQMQRRLGYQPDPVHTVEVFTADRCVDALTGPLVLRATHVVADGQAIDRITVDSDDLEILRALLDRRLTVRASPVVDSLTALAVRQVGATARRLEVPLDQVLAGLGLRISDTPEALP